MFIKTFKTLTSFLLLVGLFILLQKIDISFLIKKLPFLGAFSQKYFSPTPTSVEESVDSKTLPSNTSTMLQQKEAQPPIISLQKKVSIFPKAIKINTLTAYESLHETTSDTDESYHPSTSPCTTPIGYKIGRFDSNFGISKTMFLQEIKQASNIWGNAIGKNLFYYSETGPLTINLIYDDRQAKTKEINYLALEIENSKNAAEQVQQLYEQEKATYLTNEKHLTVDGEDFQMRYRVYTEKVNNYNQTGGASKAEYDAMTSELVQFKQEAVILEKRSSSLTSSAESINTKVRHYNELVLYINSLIKKSNSLGSKKFTEGKFSPGTNTVDIYQYSDTVKLRRVITHELGHALGITHNSNIYSIMYISNSATTTSLSKEDTQALLLICP